MRLQRINETSKTKGKHVCDACGLRAVQYHSIVLPRYVHEANTIIIVKNKKMIVLHTGAFQRMWKAGGPQAAPGRFDFQAVWYVPRAQYRPGRQGGQTGPPGAQQVGSGDPGWAPNGPRGSNMGTQGSPGVPKDLGAKVQQPTTDQKLQSAEVLPVWKCLLWP